MSDLSVWQPILNAMGGLCGTLIGGFFGAHAIVNVARSAARDEVRKVMGEMPVTNARGERALQGSRQALDIARGGQQ